MSVKDIEIFGVPGVRLRRNSGSATDARPQINLIEGSGISLTVTDDPTGDEVDVQITCSVTVDYDAPTVVLGAAAVEGSAEAALRTDCTIKAFDDGATPEALGTAATGDDAYSARRDHVHPMPDAGDVGAATAATYVVAANDSSALSKSRADAVCDGTADQSEINTAIAAVAAAGGGRVILLEGTFTVNGSIVMDNQQKVTLEGQGMGTLVTIANSANYHIIHIGGAGGDDSSYTRIKNINFDGNVDGIAGTLYIIYIYDSSGTYQKNIEISGCYFTKWETRAIYANRANGIRIVNNMFKYAGTSYALHITTTDDYVIANNVFDNGGLNLGAGNYITYSTHGVVANNVVHSINGGFNFEYNCYHTVVVGNSIYGQNTSNGRGFALTDCQYMTFADNTVYNMQYGVYVIGYIREVSFIGNHWDTTVTAFNMSPSGDCYHVILSGNEVRVASQYGFYLKRLYSSVINNNIVFWCNYDGISVVQLAAESLGLVIQGNHTSNCGMTGGNRSHIYNEATETIIDANSCGPDNQANKGLYAIKSTGNNCDIVHNDLRVGTTAPLLNTGTLCQVQGNRGTSQVQETDFRYMKNSSGGQLVAGDLVVLNAAAGGDEFTTSTTQGDDLVVGMVAATIADTAYGLVQVLGKTTALKVDGTTDIAIGDFIGCFTTAGIGQKAAAGDMAIAIALEAYTTDDSSGVIDALLITPRKI